MAEVKKSDKKVYPQVQAGDTVHWYESRHAQPQPGFVTLVEDNGSLWLAVLGHDNVALRLFDSSVRHASDPQLDAILRAEPEIGFWKEKPNQLTAAEVQALRELIAVPPVK